MFGRFKSALGLAALFSAGSAVAQNANRELYPGGLAALGIVLAAFLTFAVVVLALNKARQGAPYAKRALYVAAPLAVLLLVLAIK